MITDEILLPTAYMPSIEYIAVLSRFKCAIIEQFETFPKQTFRNRCLIYSANGVLPLSVPVEKPNGNRTITKEVLVSYNHEDWERKQWRAIESAYNSSPFFLYYKDGLQHILNQKYNKLMELNAALLHFFLSKLKIQAKITYSADFLPLENNFTNDFRYIFSPKFHHTNSTYPSYYQVFAEKWGFIPNLSILDLIFNLGPESKSYIENLNSNNHGFYKTRHKLISNT